MLCFLPIKIQLCSAGPEDICFLFSKNIKNYDSEEYHAYLPGALKQIVSDITDRNTASIRQRFHKNKLSRLSIHAHTVASVLLDAGRVTYVDGVGLEYNTKRPGDRQGASG